MQDAEHTLVFFMPYITHLPQISLGAVDIMAKRGENIGDMSGIELIIDGYSGIRKDMKERSLVKRMLADIAMSHGY